jgi:hypothetical protein
LSPFFNTGKPPFAMMLLSAVRSRWMRFEHPLRILGCQPDGWSEGFSRQASCSTMRTEPKVPKTDPQMPALRVNVG